MYNLINGTTTSIVVIMAITFFLQPLVYSRVMLAYAGFLIVALLGIARLGRRLIESQFRKHGIGVDRVLVVGAGDVGRAVMRTILAKPSLGYRVVGYVDDDPEKGNGALGRFKGLGNADNLPALIAERVMDMVIVTLPWTYQPEIAEIVARCERANLQVYIVPDVFQQRMHRVDLDSLSGIPLIGMGASRLSSGALLLKRMVDLAISILALPVLLVLYFVVAVAIKLDSPGPVLFKQRRVGRHGHHFEIYKFRSMVSNAEQFKAELQALNEADGPLFKIRDDPRLTRVGRFLRRTSIDELPQFINVLRGEMSLVGPRPGTPDEVAQYEPWQRERISILPGMTGLWQVSGRSTLPFDEMCQLDIFYIENWSLGLDLRILVQTIPQFLLGNGAY
jgi:exopolysaccharide biosynthesis polyprenyl glycosylphosphotransferase